MPRNHPTLTRRRPGNLTLLLLLVLMLLLAAFAVAVNVARLWAVRVELQGATDAGSLAAAEVLVSDDLLRNDATVLQPLLDSARAEADTFARQNPVSGRTLALDPNAANFTDGDIVFGTLDNPFSKNFTAVIDVNDPTVTPVPLINAVRVRGVLARSRGNAPGLIFGNFTGVGSAEVQTASTVMLDRDVVGFVPLGTQPVRLAPVALLADYTAVDSRSWQYQVESRKGVDQYTFDRTANTFVGGADGLYEFQAVYATDLTQLALANVQLLFIGTSDIAGLSKQLQSGVTVDQLTTFGGQFVLDAANNQLSVPAKQVGPDDSGGELTTLHNALEQLRQSAEPRIWPLQRGFDAIKNQSLVCGFVAARVVSVDPVVSGQPLTFRLQPTMISTATAVTDYTRRGVGGVPLVNPYVCKVRFVE